MTRIAWRKMVGVTEVFGQSVLSAASCAARVEARFKDAATAHCISYCLQVCLPPSPDRPNRGWKMVWWNLPRSGPSTRNACRANLRRVLPHAASAARGEQYGTRGGMQRTGHAWHLVKLRFQDFSKRVAARRNTQGRRAVIPADAMANPRIGKPTANCSCRYEC